VIPCEASCKLKLLSVYAIHDDDRTSLRTATCRRAYWEARVSDSAPSDNGTLAAINLILHVFFVIVITPLAQYAVSVIKRSSVRPSVRPSVCHVDRQQQRRPAGLLVMSGAGRAADIDR